MLFDTTIPVVLFGCIPSRKRRRMRVRMHLMKPISNRQIERLRTSVLLEAFVRHSKRYPDIAVEIYIIAGSRAP